MVIRFDSVCSGNLGIRENRKTTKIGFIDAVSSQPQHNGYNYFILENSFLFYEFAVLSANFQIGRTTKVLLYMGQRVIFLGRDFGANNNDDNYLF